MVYSRKIRSFMIYLKENHRHAYLIHLLNTYPSGEQSYDKNYFTNINEILDYLGLTYIEYDTVNNTAQHNCTRTYFIASLKTLYTEKYCA